MVIRPTVSYNTYVSYEGNIRNHAPPKKIGDIRLGELNAFVLQKFVNSLYTEKQLSSASIRLALSVLHNALEYGLGPPILRRIRASESNGNGCGRKKCPFSLGTNKRE
jgi:hypothetical protein